MSASFLFAAETSNGVGTALFLWVVGGLAVFGFGLAQWLRSDIKGAKSELKKDIEKVADDVKSINEQVSDINTHVAVLEDRSTRPQGVPLGRRCSLLRPKGRPPKAKKSPRVGTWCSIPDALPCVASVLTRPERQSGCCGTTSRDRARPSARRDAPLPTPHPPWFL